MAQDLEIFRRFKARFKAADNSDRDDYLRKMQSISDLISPNRGRFFKSRDSRANEQGRKTGKILNPHATAAYKIAVAGFKGSVIPHSLQWFKLGLLNKDLERFGPVRAWLQEVEKAMYWVYGVSGFYKAGGQCLAEQILFGTGPLQMIGDVKNVVSWRPWTIGEYTLIGDFKGDIPVKYRETWMSAGELVERFGEDRVSTGTLSMAKGSSSDTQVKIINCIYQRENNDIFAVDSLNMPFGSFWWEIDQDNYLFHGGFKEDPVACPRWDTSGEWVYGIDSPGELTIDDVKMLQKMESVETLAFTRDGDPPLDVPSFHKNVSLRAGFKNYRSKSQGNEKIESVYNLNYPYQFSIQKRQEIMDQISGGFFNPLFLQLLRDKAMTATEVVQNHEDAVGILGPVVESQNTDFLGVSNNRVFNLLMDTIGTARQLIPPVPEELAGGEQIEYTYTGLLAQAQQLIGIKPIERTWAAATAMSEFVPSVMDNIDADETLRQIADLNHAPATMLSSVADRDRKRKAQAAAQAAQVAKEDQSQEAVDAKNLASAPTNEDNMLNEVLDNG